VNDYIRLSVDSDNILTGTFILLGIPE
jgi:hypothetical protein